MQETMRGWVSGILKPKKYCKKVKKSAFFSVDVTGTDPKAAANCLPHTELKIRERKERLASSPVDFFVL